MKVIFLEDVANVARAGEVREVSDGYARNFLFPKKLAMVSKPGAEVTVKALIESKAETEKNKKLASEIDVKELTFHVKLGAKERMHGSITSDKIASELKDLIGKAADKRKIELADPIK